MYLPPSGESLTDKSHRTNETGEGPSRSRPPPCAEPPPCAWPVLPRVSTPQGEQASFLACAMCGSQRPSRKGLTAGTGQAAKDKAAKDKSPADALDGGATAPTRAVGRPKNAGTGCAGGPGDVCGAAPAAGRELLPYEEAEMLSQMRFEKQQEASAGRELLPYEEAEMLSQMRFEKQQEAVAVARESAAGGAVKQEGGSVEAERASPAVVLRVERGHRPPAVPPSAATPPQPSSSLPPTHSPAPPIPPPPSSLHDADDLDEELPPPPPPPRLWRREELHEWLAAPEQSHITLDPDQLRVVELACKHARSVFYTGPGGTRGHALRASRLRRRSWSEAPSTAEPPRASVCAGVGKSHVTSVIIAFLRAVFLEGFSKAVAITAPTGIAATHSKLACAC